MSSLGFQVEEIFIRAITEGAGLSGIYTPDLVPVHWAEDEEATDSAIMVQAVIGDQINGGCNPFEVEVTIHLRTRSDVPVAAEDQMWEAIESVTGHMGATDLGTLAPTTQTWSEGIFARTFFRYSKAKSERQSADNFRHRERMLPMEAKLA